MKNIYFTIIFLYFSLHFYSIYYFMKLPDYTELLGIVAIILFSIVILKLYKITVLKIKKHIIFLVFLLCLFHSFFGKIIHFYESISYWDKFLHFYGTFVMTYLIVYLLIQLKFFQNNNLSVFILAISIGAFLGQSLEILEYILDLFFNNNTPNQGGLTDTMLDIILNFIGSLLSYFPIKKNIS